jgi:hypothetical protein
MVKKTNRKHQKKEKNLQDLQEQRTLHKEMAGSSVDTNYAN